VQPTENEHRFNDDLLANEDDLNTIHELYPTLEYALHHPELIGYFNKFNDRANAAKRTSRKWGKYAIALGSAALVLAAIEIMARFMTVAHWSLAIGGVAALCGLSSVTMAGFGVLFGSRKREWLHNRFMGERIRQFHFQSLISLLPRILALSNVDTDKAEEAKSQFDTARRRLFVKFQADFDGNVDGQFNSVIGPYGENECWLIESKRTLEIPEGSRLMDEFFKAYRQLRIEHQLGYTNYKLQRDHKIFSAMPLRQAEVLENVSKAGIAWLLLIHVCVLLIVLFTASIEIGYKLGWFGDLFGITAVSGAEAVSFVFSLAIIVIAIVALSTRAFQEGLQPEREIERYQQYRSAVQSILEQFDEADAPNHKIRIMQQMERVTFDEMRNFLLTNDRASFAM
jgi:hypothetical protein